MNELLMTLAVKTSVLMLLAAAVNLCLGRKLSAASRHLVWTLALIGLLALPLVAAVVPSWDIPVRVIAAAPPSAAAPASEDTHAFAPSPATGPVGDAEVPAVASPATVASRSSALSLPFALDLRSMPAGRLALGLYLVGAALLGLRLGAGRWALHRLVRDSAVVTDPSWRALLRECEAELGVAEPVRLLRSLDRTMPMAFGIARPSILIPAVGDTWPEDRRRAVLLHELAHIARRDCLTQFLAALACAAYWPHPGVWWMARRLRIERELACDDRVLSAGAAPSDYASHLLELAYSLTGSTSPALVVSMARPAQLEVRMLAILDAARNRVTPSLRACAFGLALLTVVVVPLAAAEAVAVTDRAEPARAAAVAPASTSPQAARPGAEPEPAPARETSAESSPSEAQAAPPPPPPPAPPEDSRDVRRREIQLPGTWELRRSDEPDAGRVYLRLSDRPGSMHGFMIATADLAGLPAGLLSGGDGSAKFEVRRDAGTLAFDGVFRAGVGGGTFDFIPSRSFPAEMVKRGFASPNSTEQYLLARGNIGFAYLDELSAQKYERPGLDGLVRAADHGVHLDYLREMGGAGYHLGRLESLVRTRDHGVTPNYIRALAEAGYRNLSADDLVRARDHGVSAEYVGTLRALGYRDLPLEALVRARDHGVSVDFIRGMAAAGFQNLPLDTLVRARDHGVSAEFARAMREAGYASASIEELVKARDRGVSADFIQAMAALGPERPSLDELSDARSHGVSPDFARAWRDLGYPPVLADLTRARDHGVSEDFIRELKSLGYDRLPVDDLVRLRDNGVNAKFIREQNAGATTRLSVDQLLRRRNRS